MRVLLLITLLFTSSIYSQESYYDSLGVKYRLLTTQYNPKDVVIKIAVPPYLNTREVMDQVRLCVQLPGQPLPTKKTGRFKHGISAHQGTGNRRRHHG